MTGPPLRLARFGKFNLVGILGAALQLFLIYLQTKHFHVNALVATPVAVEIAVLHNFAWHELFTWRDCGLKSLRQRMIRLWRFHAGNGLVSLFGNSILTYCLVERLKTPVLPSVLAAIALCSLINFFIADQWVYGLHHPST